MADDPPLISAETATDAPLPPPDVVGWREWAGLPDLGIRRIKAKIDTGAKSSAIHAYNVRVFARGGTEIVSFDLHPRQRNERVVVSTEAEVLEFRKVRNSGGAVDTRPVIVTHAVLFGRRFPIELTLANRDEMGYRMLIGREALRGRFLVDADQSFLGERWPLGRTGPFTSP
ncbi:MAG: RimK/LysX family protein [Planctomycetaceae bacterium]